MAIVGTAILVAAAAFILWPDGSGDSEDGDATAQSSKGGKSAGGIGERPVDSAANQSRAASAATQRSRGFQQPGEIEKPEPKTLEEKIEAKKREIKLAEMRIKQIEKGLERYPKIREDAIAGSDNPDFTTRSYDRKKERMDLNLERAKEDLETFMAELEELQSSG